MDPTQIIIAPVLSEKSTMLETRLQKYTFRVAITATKIDIRRAIESLGNCAVRKVNTMIVKGKKRRTRKGGTAKRPNWKKAIVTLRDGESLGGMLGDAFEGV